MRQWSVKHFGWVSWVLIGLTLILTAANIVWTYHTKRDLAKELAVTQAQATAYQSTLGAQVAENQVMLNRYLNGAYLWRLAISAKQDTILNILRKR